jgi:predicted house-cleaning noncanonical NTP pyrophosphatase (MazG superfamily)
MNTAERNQLVRDYVDQILDNMSTKDLMRIVGEQLEENLANYSDEELIEEIKDYYPELLD